jgi:hypothetical protein
VAWGRWPFCCGLLSPVSGLHSRRCPSPFAFCLGSGRGLKPGAWGLESFPFGFHSGLGFRSGFGFHGGFEPGGRFHFGRAFSGLEPGAWGLGPCHFGRSSRGLKPGAWGPGPLFLNSKRLSLLFWFFRFLASLYGCRGSRWVPPGRQLRSRDCRSASAERCLNAAVASAGEAHSFPRANHRISASGCFWRSRLNVGSISSRSAARNAVGRPPTRIVQ